MKPSHDDFSRNFESSDASAQTSEAKTEGANLERPRETNASRDGAAGARCHAPDASVPAADARADAKDAGEEEKEEVIFRKLLRSVSDMTQNTEAMSPETGSVIVTMKFLNLLRQVPIASLDSLYQRAKRAAEYECSEHLGLAGLLVEPIRGHFPARYLG